MSICANAAHRSCSHQREVRWRWETKDGCAGTFCHECLLAVGISWPDLLGVLRTSEPPPKEPPQSFLFSRGGDWTLGGPD